MEQLIYPKYELLRAADGDYILSDSQELYVGQTDYIEHEPFLVENSEFILEDGKVLNVRVFPVKYLLRFASERGYDYAIEVREQGYNGPTQKKKLGSAPVLHINEGDGCVQGTSLSFTIQADENGELESLYTTDNKQYQVVLYRNGRFIWIGYLLPELYSENYVDAPYDVSVTASDQLATLKAITYEGADESVLLKDVINDVLALSSLNLSLCYHVFINSNPKADKPFFETAYINRSAFNGYNCYDVLNAILSAANCRIMQLNGRWFITSVTDTSEQYYLDGKLLAQSHKRLGSMGSAEVYPNGSLSMVNSPALKGATVEYSHILKKSLLKNADCESSEWWNYTPDSRKDERLPGKIEQFGKTFKAYCWDLHPNNIQSNNSLQLWQEVEVDLEKDEGVPYSISVKYLFGTNAKLLLMSVVHRGADGVDRHLTGNGWVTQYDKSDVNSYIQITGTAKSASVDVISDIEQYEIATVTFTLPEVDGSLRIGFINSTENYAEPLAAAPIYVTQVYLTLGAVDGIKSTTIIEPRATIEQQSVLLAYGDDVMSANSAKLALNTLRRADGTPFTAWWLNGQDFSSYFMMMLQEYSRYYGSKKRQLQGTLMGKDVLAYIYRDEYSRKLFRLVNAEYNLFEEEVGVVLEEIVDSWVEYQEGEIFGTNNNPGVDLGGNKVEQAPPIQDSPGSGWVLKEDLDRVNSVVMQQAALISQLAERLNEADRTLVAVDTRLKSLELRE